MLRNVASQKWRVYAWDATTGLPKTGDAANISAKIQIDDGAEATTNDTAPTEVQATNQKGYYEFDLTQAETNGAKLSLAPQSSTSNIVVIACPPVVYTRAQYASLAGISSGGVHTANTTQIGSQNVGLSSDNRLRVDVAEWNDIPLATTNPLPNAVAGASSGLMICGTNAGNIVFSGTWTQTGHMLYSDGIEIAAPSTSNRAGFKTTGNGTGNGINVLSGMLVTASSGGNALTLTPNGGNGSGLRATGVGSGSGIYASNGTSTGAGIRASGYQGSGLLAESSNGGDGLRATGGSGGKGVSVVGDTGGIVVTTTSSGPGLSVAGAGADAGFVATGGATGNGASFVGGSTSGDGINCSVTSGVELRANITGDITGTASGNATAAQGANLDAAVSSRASQTSVDDLPTVAELATALAAADDAVLAAIAALNNLSAAEVNAEVVDALATDTYAEPGQGNPAATTSLAAKLNYLYKAWRNKKTKTATESALYNDAGDTVDQKTTDSDDGTTATRGEQVSGP